MLSGRLDIGEGEIAVCVRHALHLIETGERIAHMARVGQRLFLLLREGIDAIWQIAPRRQIAVLGIRLPGGLHGLNPPWTLMLRKTRNHIFWILRRISTQPFRLRKRLTSGTSSPSAVARSI